MLTLTPQARAVAAFTLAIALLTTQLNRVTVAVLVLFGDSFPHGRSGLFLAGLILVAVGGFVVLFALAASKGLSNGWESTLADAAVLIAVVGLGIDVVTVVGAVIHDSSFGLFGVLSSNVAG